MNNVTNSNNGVGKAQTTVETGAATNNDTLAKTDAPKTSIGDKKPATPKGKSKKRAKANRAPIMVDQETADRMAIASVYDALLGHAPGNSAGDNAGAAFDSVTLMALEMEARREGGEAWKADEWVSIGDGYIRMDMYEEALHAYQRAYEIAPEQIYTQMQLAAAYLELERADEAYPLLMDVTEEEVEQVGFKYWVTLARCYYLLGRHEDVRTAVKKALEYEDEHPECRTLLKLAGLL